jgi:cytochrome c oxidase subunit 2
MKKTSQTSILFSLGTYFNSFSKRNLIGNFSFFLVCDAPDFWQLRLQDPASSIMEGILLFNKHLLFIVVMIVLLTAWLLFNTIYSYDEFNSSQPENFFHSNELEIVWTSLPALTLLTLASPSFSLLYSMDEISIPDFSIKILGHQWFWSYEISDFRSCLQTTTLKYACYMLSNEELRNCKGFFRNLETNKRVILPTNTHMRLLVSAVDVLHSWTIPSFGLKIDACPGRLNQVNLFIKRFGVFFGQCSEICGVNHGFMPIVLLTLPTSQYHYLIMTNLESHSN